MQNLSETPVVLQTELQAFLDAKRAARSAGTLRFYREKLGHVVAFLDARGVETVEDLVAGDVRAFLASLADHSQGGQRAYWRATRAWLNWCRAEFGLDSDPLANVDAPNGKSQAMQAASLDDVAAMLDACDRRTFCGRRDHAVLRTLLDTGLRASELLRLDLDDLHGGDIRVRPEVAKTKVPRTVFLGNKAQRALAMYQARRRDDCEALWVTRYGTRLSYQGLRSAFRRLCSAAGLDEDVSPHQVRKACATALLRAGASLEHIRRLLGHTSLETTQRYLRLSDDDVRQAVQAHSPGDLL